MSESVSHDARVAAVVLAAGASTRMGRPKALLRWRGKALVEHCVELARSVTHGERVVVVEGAHGLEGLSLAAERVRNEAWSKGQLSSLQVGVGAARVGEGVTGIVVLSVDRPHVRPATVAELVDAHRRDPSAIWQPKYRARLGHPILYPADLFDEILALDPSSTMRSLLARPDVRGRRCAVEVDDPAVLDNIDTPQDWERLRGLV